MAIDFPNAPALNAVFASGAQSWRWDGTKWVATTGGPEVIPPPGTIFAFAAAPGSIPAGWYACNGQNVPRASNPLLFNLFNTMTGGLAVWGAGDGSTTFGIPDLRGRVPAGMDNMGGAQGAAGRLAIGFGLASVGLGGFCGEQSHTITQAEQATHNHLYNVRSNPTAFGASGAGQTVGGTLVQVGTINGGGSDTDHNNMQPTVLVNYIIKGG